MSLASWFHFQLRYCGHLPLLPISLTPAGAPFCLPLAWVNLVPWLLLVWPAGAGGRSVGAWAWSSAAVQGLWLAGPRQAHSVGGAGRSLSPWLQLGTAGAFVNRPFPGAPRGWQSLTSPLRPPGHFRSAGAETGFRSAAPGQMRGLRPWGLYPACVLM